MARRLFLSRLLQLAALPLVVANGSVQGQGTHRSLKILMKSAWGLRRPNQGGVSLLARACTRGSRTRSTDLPAGRSCRADAENGRQRGHTRRMATCR
jgi:hypothetical protein